MAKRHHKRHRKHSLHSTKVVHKVVHNSASGKQVAAALTNAARYPYRANALLMGFVPLSPYDPIRLVGLTDNMEGIWVVLSITHTFKKEFPYSMKVLLGSNEKLLNAPQPEKVTDISNADFPVDEDYISELFDQNDMFLEVTNDDTGDFYLESIEFDVVTPEDDPVSDVNDPVIEFIDALDEAVYEATEDPFEGVVYDRDPFEVITPDFTSSSLEDEWIQESYT